MTEYRLRDLIPEQLQKELAHIAPLSQQLLYARGVTTKHDADAFLAPNYASRYDPFLMLDMEKAVERVLSAIHSNERIAIWSDYDCDGIPGGVLAHDFLKAVGFNNFENYIPHRHDEGYGLNTDALATLLDRGATLIITIDCGTNDHEAIEFANARGADVIVVDHHELPKELPNAFALLNPKRGSYPTADLCGTGVAWKLIEGLRARGNFSLAEGKEKWFLDVVGLATLADMVPLTSENRIFARYGLEVLRKTRRAGLRELFRILRVDARTMNEDDVGFLIAPRINAASRMGKPEDAFLMLTADEESAPLHAQHLDRINNERKGVVAAMVKDAKRKLSERAEIDPVIVIGNPEWRPSLVGLVANTLSEEHRRPVFAWGRDGRDVFKGSCRSDGSVSVVSIMEEARDSLIEFGGHHASGGFSVHAEHIHTFPIHINDAHRKISSGSAMEPIEYIDADLSLTEVTDSLYREIESLSPFGEGNPKPLFRFRGVTPAAVEQFGKTKEHLRADFETNGRKLEAIAFFKTPESFSHMIARGKPVDIVGHIERSYFGGRTRLRLRIVDVI